MTKKGQKTGAKLPSSYDVGNPAVNFYLAILSNAKEEHAPMWKDFKKTELYKQGQRGVPDGLETAWWVALYLKSNT